MSAERTSGRLLRLYPPAWRARYGAELSELVVAASGGDRVPWRVRADVALAGARERLRAMGAGDGGPAAGRVRSGALVVLYAWALCVIGGGVMQKASEHWQQLVTPGTRVVPEVAFVVLVVCALVGGALVLAGIGAALPALTGFLLAGGWPQLRRTVRPAAALAVALAAATAGLALWSRGLSDGQRNGDDALYAAAFLAWVVLAAACLIAWTAAAVSLARRLRLTAAALRAEAWLAAGVTAAMAAVTAATVTWWIAVAGTQAAPLASELGVATGLMAVATLAGAAGTRHAHRALRAL